MAVITKKEAVFRKAESLVKKGCNFERFKEKLRKISKNLSEEHLLDIWFAVMVNKIPKEKLLLD